MVNFVVTYDKSILGQLAVTIANAPQEIADYVKDELPAFLRTEITPLTTEPRLPTLPFVWSYDPVSNARLRRKYFATLPAGSRGGRYVRTHQLVNAWKTAGRATRDGAEATVSNDTPYLDTVQGPDSVRYPSHADSGWAQYDDVLDKTAVRAVDRITDRWLQVLDGKASP